MLKMKKLFVFLFLVGLLVIGSNHIDAATKTVVKEFRINLNDKKDLKKIGYNNVNDFLKSLPKEDRKEIQKILDKSKQKGIQANATGQFNLLGAWITYRTTVTTSWDSTDWKNCFAVAYVEPGSTATISGSVSKNATISANAGIPISAINATIGFTIGKSYTVTVSQTTKKAPKTHNGKKVNKMIVRAYPVYKNKTVKIEYKLNGSWKEMRKVTTKRVYGSNMETTYTYKK